MTARRRKNEDPLESVRAALIRMEEPISWDDLRGKSEGAEDVEAALDAMATALSALKGLDLGAAPLDEVLAEIKADDALVDMAAELIELLGQVDYAGGLSREDAVAAEGCREDLHAALDNLLTELQAEQENA